MRIMVIMHTAREYYTEEEVEARRRVLLAHASPGTHVELGFAERGKCFTDPTPLQSDVDFAAPWVAKKAKEAEEAGYDAVMSHGYYDVGVDAAKHLVSIPVVGPGRTTVHVAAMLADRIGMIVTHDWGISVVRRLLRSWGVENLFTPIRAINIPMLEVRTRKEENRERVITLARRAVEEGAELILPFCLVNIPVHMSPKEVEDAVGVPVLDGDAISIRIAEMLVGLGLSHSRKTYPPHKAYQELLKQLV